MISGCTIAGMKYSAFNIVKCFVYAFVLDRFLVYFSLPCTDYPEL